MKVILREDVDKLGRTGDTVEVADGYSRNFLLPRGLAVRASTRNVKVLEHQKKVIDARKAKQRDDAQGLAQLLESKSCTIARKVGEEEKLFGSVTSRDIESALREEGVTLDRKRILLDEPIKKLGVYTVPVKLHQEVRGSIKVWVVEE